MIFFKVYQGWPPMNFQFVLRKLIWKYKKPCEGWKVTFFKSCILLLLWPSQVAGNSDQEEKLAATANHTSFWRQTFARMFLSMIRISHQNIMTIHQVFSIFDQPSKDVIVDVILFLKFTSLHYCPKHYSSLSKLDSSVTNVIGVLSSNPK